MHKRLVTRYATRSSDAADENERRVRGVFEALHDEKPGNVSYIVLRLADNSFVQFQDGHETRRQGDVDQQTAKLVGAYITRIE